MASLIVNRGLQVIGGRASNTVDAFAQIQTGVVDDSSTAFVLSNTTLGSPTNFFAQAIATARTNESVAHTWTITTANGNFTIRRISLHNVAAGSVIGTSVSLCLGVDAQNFVKTSAFQLALTLTLSYQNV